MKKALFIMLVVVIALAVATATADAKVKGKKVKCPACGNGKHIECPYWCGDRHMTPAEIQDLEISEMRLDPVGMTQEEKNKLTPWFRVGGKK